MKHVLVALFALFLVACSTSGDYQQYLAAQQAATSAALAAHKPLVLIEAHEGQPITGLKRIEVNTPMEAPVVQQSRPNEWAAVADRAIGVLGTGLGLKLGGDAAIGLAREVGRASSTGYGFVQAPGAVTTTNTTIGANSGANSGNSGRLAGGDVTDSTHTPLIARPEVVVVPTQVVTP